MGTIHCYTEGTMVLHFGVEAGMQSSCNLISALHSASLAEVRLTVALTPTLVREVEMYATL